MKVRGRTDRLSIGSWTLLLILAAMAMFAGHAHAWTYKVLYNFCTEYDCYDGKAPQSKLLIDAAGNLFGVTQLGGRTGAGAAFKLSPTPDGWKYRRIYSFCSRFSCSDGLTPNGPLIVDVTGNLYGTTQYGGVNNDGTAFELVDAVNKERYSFHDLHDFAFNPDGRFPAAGLTYAGAASGAPYDGNSPLFGTTTAGGIAGGTAFQLTPGGGTWSEAVIYNFCSQSDCEDGLNPSSELSVDSSGHLYGTTPYGKGGYNGESGLLYRLGYASGQWSETIVHTFCGLKNCRDGRFPLSALTIDGLGNLLGSTPVGGTQKKGCCGTLFTVQIDGSGFATLYDFCSRRDCKDGVRPDGTLTQDSAGVLYGVATNGGGNYDGEDDSAAGTVFALNGSAFEALHRFCSERDCADGKHPFGGVVIDPAGDLYGTTEAGGKFNAGVVFELTP